MGKDLSFLVWNVPANKRQTVECLRCGMSFPILDVPQNNLISTVCAEENCTRSFSDRSRAEGFEAKVYQTRMNVSNTVCAAKYRREHGLKVDNGGCQDFV